MEDNQLWTRLADLLTYDASAPLIFSSGFFLWMFAAFMAVYVLLRHRHRARIVFVILFSYYFYYKSSGFFFFLLAVVTATDYYIAHWMQRATVQWRRKALVTLSVVINLGLLCYFKYTNFLGQAWADITGGTFDTLDIFLPVGISFFTFQSLSYTIDVYRRRITALDSIMDYAFFVSFFPQLVAGPIVRAKDFIPQIRRPLVVTRQMLGEGLYFIICGLFKKVVIGDYISVNFVERIFDNPSLYSGLENLVGLYGYALQIYCDFSGYSDMAIGIALLLGFRFNINFDSPYKSASITEFWRRWHISLSSWLKDYLYISLGGNRKGRFRQYVNLILTMLLGGLWHGASWNFVLWGLMHGVGLAAHKVWMAVTGQKVGQRHGPVAQLLCVLLTFHFVCLGWIFFRNTSFENSWAMLGQMAGSFHLELLPQLVAGYWQVMLVMLVGFILHFLPSRWESAAKRAMVKMPLWCCWLLLMATIVLVIQMKSTEIQPFIYFQF